MSTSLVLANPWQGALIAMLVAAAPAPQFGEDVLSMAPIIVRERAYIRRNIVSNLFARIVEARLFYNPAISIMQHGLGAEREAACDNWAVAATRYLDSYTSFLMQLALKPGSARIDRGGARKIASNRYLVTASVALFFSCAFALQTLRSNAEAAYSASSSSTTLSLADAQRRALAYAPAVAAARARVSEAQAQLRFARGTGGPSAVASYSQMPQAGLERLSGAEQKITTAGAEFPISAFLAREPLVAAAEADLRSAQESELDTERRERIKVIDLYIDAQRAHAVRVLREQIEDYSIEDERVADERHHEGKGSHLDISRTEVLHFQAEAHLEIAVDDERVAGAALALEIRSDEAAISLQALPFIMPGVPRTPIGGALAIALEKRPEIAAAQAEVDAAADRVCAAQRAGLPQLTAQFGYAYGVDTQLDINGPAGTVTLAFPLSGQPAAEATAAQARRDRAQAQLAAARQAVTLDVEAALATLRSDVFRNDFVTPETALSVAESVADSFRRGKTSGLALVEARQTYNDVAFDAIAGSAALDDAEDTWPLVLGEMPQ